MALGTPRQLLATALSVLVATQLTSAQPAARRTDVGRLQQLETELSFQFLVDHALAVQWANQSGLPVRESHPDGRVTALMFLREGRPYVYGTHNASAADSVCTDELWAGGSSGLDLDGSGVLLHQWDGSEVRLTHQELVGAASWADDTMYGYSSHSTHVAGTMVASGVELAARGMSYAATVDAYDFYDDNAEMAAAAAAGARLSNHSYGWVRGWYYKSSEDMWYWYGDPAVSATEDASFGFYDGTARAWDEIAYNAPFYLICKSAGNDRDDDHVGEHKAYSISYSWELSTAARDPDGGATGYDSLSQQACAKNILTVGAVNDVAGGYAQPADVVMSSFSGWGPTDDGRIKPDIVANGITLYSAVASSDTAYGWYSGTSMATPRTTGSLGLLIQHHRATHGLLDMRSATLKGVVIHTADEAGASPGPDYSFGWGLLNVLGAAQYIGLDETSPEVIQELSLTQGETFEQSWIYDGQNPVQATICWTDPAGTPVPAALDPPDLMLVNDLDLRIIGPGSVVYEPWRLDPAAPAAAATRGDNFRDNVEVVLIDTPIPGMYTIEVTHKGTLVNAPQDFALILTPPTAAPDAGPPAYAGLYRNGNWFLDLNGNDQWDGPGPDGQFGFGLPIDTPVVGDWNGDDTDEVGLFRNGTWFLDLNGNDQWDGPGTDAKFTFGLPTDTPVAGDWNGDGTDEVGLFRNGTWFLDLNGNDQWDGPGTDAKFTFGLPTDTPVAGDWNGDGTDEAGLFRNGNWLLDLNGNNQWDGPGTDAKFTFGLPTDTPVAGDWNGDGTDEVGLFRNGNWLLDLDGNNQWDGPGTDARFGFGLPTDTPVPGRWVD